MADKEVSKNYFNIPSTLKNDEVLVYYHLCKSTNFTAEEFRGMSRFECFASKRTLSEDTGIGDKKVLLILKGLEKQGYIKLVSKGKPPKTPSKYRMIYAECLKNVEPLNEPIKEPLREPFESTGNKGFGLYCEPLKEPLEEPLKEPPSKDISKDKSNIYVEIIDYLNKKANTRYRSNTKDTRVLIKKRLNDGFLLEDFMKVIDNKILDWKDTEYEKFIRPKTLFSEKFERYLNEKVITKPKEEAKRRQTNLDDL
ncbi:conserved phage C-terminal domain-containing protein [Clostridium perfringens]|nr:conserved phage C-terminal domain-containing protein [Clostridium perfringens]